jgi:hypothetical protein
MSCISGIDLQYSIFVGATSLRKIRPMFDGVDFKRETAEVEIVRTSEAETLPANSVPIVDASLEVECVDALRRILAEQINLAVPSSVDAAAERFRALIRDGNDDAIVISALMKAQETVRPGIDLFERTSANAAFLIAAVSCVLEPGMPDQDVLGETSFEIDELVSVSALSSADWLQIAVNGAKRGAGQYFGADDLYDWIEDDVNPDELVTIEMATAWTDRMWNTIGVTNEERLTESGAWLLPRAVCFAWGASFDTQ